MFTCSLARITKGIDHPLQSDGNVKQIWPIQSDWHGFYSDCASSPITIGLLGSMETQLLMYSFIDPVGLSAGCMVYSVFHVFVWHIHYLVVWMDTVEGYFFHSFVHTDCWLIDWLIDWLIVYFGRMDGGLINSFKWIGWFLDVLIYSVGKLDESSVHSNRWVGWLFDSFIWLNKFLMYWFCESNLFSLLFLRNIQSYLFNCLHFEQIENGMKYDFCRFDMNQMLFETIFKYALF